MKSCLAATLLLLAGCGGTKEKPVRIATFPGITEVFPLYLCQDLGHFREAGVETSIEELASGTKLVEALLGGSADAVFHAYLQTIQLAISGKRLQSVFVSSIRPTSLLVVSPSKADRIRKVEDLMGATVGVAGLGAAHQQFLAHAFLRRGLNIRDLNFVAFGTGPSAVASIEHSKVDAGMINGSAYEVLRRRANGIRVLEDPRTREGMMSASGFDAFANFCLVSTKDWISRNREQVTRMVRAMRKTHAWIRAHTVEEVLDRLPARFRTDNREADIATLGTVIASLSIEGRMPAGAPENVLRMLSASMETAGKVDLSTTWTNEFVEAQ